MKKLMMKITIILSVFSVLFILLNLHFNTGLFFSCAITFCTALYHFSMRLFVGTFCQKFIEPKLNCNSKWFSEFKFEKKLYKALRVKKWKSKAPTYNPEKFSLENNSKEAIIKAMCGAEVVHEIIIVFSFLPIVASNWLDSTVEFIITSVVAAVVDLIFVIIQRYNRPRVRRILKKKFGL